MTNLRPERILKELLGVLRASRRRLNRGPDAWTPLGPSIFSCLRRLGTSAGFKVWNSRETGAYLWDIAWTYEPRRVRRYWLELAGEIELADSDYASLMDDFYKVLDAKARLKVFVGGSPTRRMVEKICKGIDWAVTHQRFRLPEERLITIVLDYDGRKDTYLHRVRLFDGSGPTGKWSREWEEVKFRG